MDLLRRPGRAAAPPDRRSGATALWIAALAGLAAAAGGLIVVAALVLVAWGAAADSTGSAPDALRTAGQVWLFAHHSGVRTSIGGVDLVPLGLLAVPVLLLARAGTVVARRVELRGVGEAARAVLVLAGCYAVAGAAVQVAVRGTTIQVGLLGAIGSTIVVAALAGAVGVARGAQLGPVLAGRLPAAAPAVCRAALLAVAALLAGGGLLAATALCLHAGRFAALTRGLQPGVVGGILLLLLGLLFVPNAVVWATAYLSGPGFAVGTGTTVSMFGVTLGSVPAFPLLSGLPQTADLPALHWLGLAVPVVAGGLAGRLLARRLTGSPALHLVGWAAATGPVAGAAFAVLAVLSGGKVGDGRLSAVGPSSWQIGVAVAVEVAVIACLAVALIRWRQHRREAAAEA
jgi:hypothetical protein